MIVPRRRPKAKTSIQKNEVRACDRQRLNRWTAARWDVGVVVSGMAAPGFVIHAPGQSVVSDCSELRPVGRKSGEYRRPTLSQKRESVGHPARTQGAPRRERVGDLVGFIDTLSIGP